MQSPRGPLKRRRVSSPPGDDICPPVNSRELRHLPKRRFVDPTPGHAKAKLRPSLLHDRGDVGLFSSSSDTETDDTSEDDLGTALSDVESVVRNSERVDSSPADGDDEEIDVVLMAPKHSPSSPIMEAWPAEKGKTVDAMEYGGGSRKRRRMVESPISDGEGDDEMETDMMLGMRDKKERRTLLGPGSGRRTTHRVSLVPSRTDGCVQSLAICEKTIPSFRLGQGQW